MSGFCAEPSDGAGLVRGLLGDVDCNIQAISQIGYHTISGPGSQLAFALTAVMTIYIAVFGFRLLTGLAPLRIGEVTIMAIKLGIVLVLATSWPTYQHLIFETLFRGPEQIAASLMGALQSPDAEFGGNPYDALQAEYDQMQAAAAFFARISQPTASPLLGGVPFMALALNVASFLALFATLGVVIAAKVALGLLLALGPIFIAFLLFDSTRGVFEGWLRASLAFAIIPLFITMALALELALLAPHLVAMSAMISSGDPNIPDATSAFLLSVIFAMISLAGVLGILIIALGLKFRWLNGSSRAISGSVAMAQAPAAAASQARPQPALPRVTAVTAAAAFMDRRDSRIESADGPRRLDIGAKRGVDSTNPSSRLFLEQTYRRSAQSRRAASNARRDR